MDTQCTHYFLIRETYRILACDARNRVREHYVKFDIYSDKLTNILGLANEIGGLKINSQNNGTFKAESNNSFNHVYEIVKELTEEELKAIKDKNPSKVKLVEEQRRFEIEDDAQQLKYFENFFNHIAKQEPIFCFDKQGNFTSISDVVNSNYRK